MSDQSPEQTTAGKPEGGQIDYDPEVLDQVLDDAATQDRPDAFDADAAAKVVGEADRSRDGEAAGDSADGSGDRSDTGDSSQDDLRRPSP